MSATAAAYAGMADALLAAAGGSDGSTSALAASWRSATSDRAQAAFRRHANWLRQQSVVAGRAAVAASAVAAAYSAAQAYAAAALPVILANRTLSVGLAATNTMGQNTPAIAANESMYMGLWVQTAAVMNGYAAEAMSAMSSVPPPTPAPGIATPGGVAVPHFAPGAPTGLGGGVADVANSANAAAEQVANEAANEAANQMAKPVSDAAQSLTDQATSPQALAQQAISDGNSSTLTPADTLAGPNGGGVGGGSMEHGFSGTSPYSTTLAGLNGGMGSLVGLGMIQGGLGSMSGASTGFRLPSNWPSGPGTAFGAALPPPIGASVAPPVAPRGATAPAGQLLRRAEERQRQPGKVFVPGEPEDVPVFDRASAIGVLEYADEDGAEDALAADSMLLGLLGPATEDTEFPT